MHSIVTFRQFFKYARFQS